MSPDHTVACWQKQAKVARMVYYFWWIFKVGIWYVFGVNVDFTEPVVWFLFDQKYSKNCNIIKYLLQFQITVVYLNIF